MGQRLNIEITKGEKVLANAYYHWSAYSLSSVELLETAITAYEDALYDMMAGAYISSIDDYIAMAVHMLEATGAGINEGERERISICDDYPDMQFKDCVNRNSGILAITPEGIEETENWAEGCIVIDIESLTIDFGVAWKESKEEHISDLVNYSPKNDEEAEAAYNTYPHIPFEMESLKFDEVEVLKRFIEHYEYVVDDDGYVYTWIQ